MEALVILIIFSPALAFFAGRTFLKYQEIKHRSGGALDAGATKRLDALEAENAELRERIETLRPSRRRRWASTAPRSSKSSKPKSAGDHIRV